MGKGNVKKFFRGIGAGLLAAFVLIGVFLGGILLEIPEKAKDNQWVVEEEKEPYVSSPRWKRIAAWILFGIVVLGIICWLFNIAVPEWPELLRGSAS